MERPERAFEDLGVPRHVARTARGVTSLTNGRRRQRKGLLDVFSWGTDDDDLPDEIAAAALATQPPAPPGAAPLPGLLPPGSSSPDSPPPPPPPPPPAAALAGPDSASLDEVYGEAWDAKVERLRRGARGARIEPNPVQAHARARARGLQPRSKHPRARTPSSGCCLR